MASKKEGFWKQLFWLFRSQPAKDSENVGSVGVEGITIQSALAYGGQMPYVVRAEFMTKGEMSFFKVLQHLLGDKAVIFPKVSLGDVFFVNTRSRRQQTIYWSKLALQNVDFLICSRNTLEPLCAIELHDVIPKRGEELENDAFVAEVFRFAGLKLLRFKHKNSYSLFEVKDKVTPLFKTESLEKLKINNDR